MNGKEVSGTAEAKCSGAMGLATMAIGWITKLMALAISIILTAIFTRVTGPTIKYMGSVFTYTLTGQSTKVSGSKISKTVWE